MVEPSFPDPGLPSVSVVIPAFNAEKTLAETLESVAGQTHPPIDVFVVDDGSTDRTAEIAKGFAGRIAGLKVLSVENGGPGRARNIGASQARGELIALLDADDIWHPAYLEKIARRFEERGPGTVLVFAFHRRIDYDDIVLSSPSWPELEGFVFYRLLWWAFIGTGSAFVVRRSALASVGGFAEDRMQSDDLHGELRLAWIGDFSMVREYLVGYRRVAGQMSSRPIQLTIYGTNTLRAIRREIPEIDRGELRAAIASRAGRAIRDSMRARLYGTALRMALLGLRTAPLVFMRMAVSPHLGLALGRNKHDPRRQPERFQDLDPTLPPMRPLADSYFSRRLLSREALDLKEVERRVAGGKWTPPQVAPLDSA